MNDRVFVIPARKVVAGMIIAQGRWSGRTIMKVAGYGRYVASGERFMDSDWFEDLADRDVAVTLPGPSPRDVEANGGVCRCGAGAMGEHAKDCPADNLRLWPVGATWDDAQEAWMLPAPGTIQYRIAMPVRSLLRELVHFYGLPDRVREAFCEPEVQR